MTTIEGLISPALNKAEATAGRRTQPQADGAENIFALLDDLLLEVDSEAELADLPLAPDASEELPETEDLAMSETILSFAPVLLAAKASVADTPSAKNVEADDVLSIEETALPKSEGEETLSEAIKQDGEAVVLASTSTSDTTAPTVAAKTESAVTQPPAATQAAASTPDPIQPPSAEPARTTTNTAPATSSAATTMSTPTGESAKGESGGSDSPEQGSSTAQTAQPANFSAHPAQTAPFRIEAAAARDSTVLPNPATAAQPAQEAATTQPTADVAVQLQQNNRLNIELATSDRNMALRLDAATDQLIADLRQVGSEVEAVRVELRNTLTPEQFSRNDQQTSRQMDQSGDADGGRATDASNARKSSIGSDADRTELRLSATAGASPGNIDRYA